MVLSIVTGTWNRLSYLKDFMASCESSIKPNISHEYCICDAGSTDGTLSWLHGEANDLYNITLVEHGELKGAIKAFNDAAAVAKGDYLLIGNDDVEVIGNSITCALGELMSDPELGGACFYQDRAGQDWHVEEMQIVMADGQVRLSPYLQVGIIPRFLWEHAGGWGDFGSNTYGGDNWVSAKIYEAGYSIRAVEGARIHDRTPIDELRKVNNELNRGGADGQKFYAAFPNGIKYNAKPQINNPLYGKYKKILYAPIYEANNRVQKEQKRGLREALEKRGIVWEVDYIGGENLVAAAQEWKPHITVTQLHSADRATVDAVRGIRKHTSERMVNWNGDVWPEQQQTPEYAECLRMFDLHTGVNEKLKPYFESQGITYSYLQIGFEPGTIGRESTSHCEVVFIGNAYAEARKELATKLKSLPHNVKIWGYGYPDGVTEGSTLYDFNKTGDIVRGAKIVIGDNQFGDDGFVSNRLFESLAAGQAMLLHQKVPGMDKLIGFEDKKHYVEFSDFDDMAKKIEYYLSHEEERAEIALAGHTECINNHSFDHRVEELFDILKNKSKKNCKISMHMICKDEIKNVNSVLKQCEEFAEEIIVVDTGSTDGTLEALSAYKEHCPKLKVFTQAWEDDFGAARNAAMEHCTQPWIMWMDFDDKIPTDTINQLKKFHKWEPLCAKNNIYNPMAFKLLLIDASNHQAAMQTRLFRKIPGVRWDKTVHETVDQSLVDLGIYPIEMMTAKVYHQGNIDRKAVLNKQRRNLRIINKMPDSSWKFLTMAWTHLACGFWSDAIVCCMIIFKRYEGEKDQDLSDHCNFIAGFCFKELNLIPEALTSLQASKAKDAYYLLSILDPSNMATHLMKFLATPIPQNLPTFGIAWERDAKARLLGWHQQELKKLNL